MPRIAKEDTYATEPVGPDVEVRRKVMAGDPVPDHYQIEGAVDETDDPEPEPPGYGSRNLTRRPKAERQGQTSSHATPQQTGAPQSAAPSGREESS